MQETNQEKRRTELQNQKPHPVDDDDSPDGERAKTK